MRKLLMVAFQLSLWLALVTGTVHAQTHANGEFRDGRYLVAPGDTVYSISRRFGVSEDALKLENGIIVPERDLQHGTWIRIPGFSPKPSASCTTSNLWIGEPSPNRTVETIFTVAGSGCGLSRNDVAIYVRVDSGPWMLVANPVPLVGSYPGEGIYTVPLNIVSLQGQGQRLTIIAKSDKTESAPVTVNFPNAPANCSSTNLAVSAPGNGESTSSTLVVRGVAGPNCTVILTARDSNGRVLGTVTTKARTDGSWSETLTLQERDLIGGNMTIEVRVLETGVAQWLNVTVRLYKNLNAPWCQLIINYPVNAFTNPEGLLVGPVTGLNTLYPRRVVNFGGQLWYAIPGGFAGSVFDQADAWVRGKDVTTTNGDCGL